MNVYLLHFFIYFIRVSCLEKIASYRNDITGKIVIKNEIFQLLNYTKSEFLKKSRINNLIKLSIFHLSDLIKIVLFDYGRFDKLGTRSKITQKKM